MERLRKTLNMVSDAVLARSVRRGNNLAFAILVNRHSPRLISYLHYQIHDSEIEKDVLQDVWLLILKLLRTWHYKESGHFAKWINKIAFVKGRKALHREWNFVHHLDEEILVTEETQEKIYRDDAASSVKKYCSILSERFKRIVLLHAIEGFSYKEIGSMMNLSADEVRVYYWRAIERIKKYFAKGVTKRG